ncbi:hypothetical protein OPT61_g5829 [Boeremia exigua]|uniref:Uncharacterized protein n=1 Tax=Boeremia exigua TaxID=749465 RepID=A0ACC2I959_9PLEO|nr:hypothetical protein OPT61_g5829 [Boeremia exigua]
MATTMRTLLPLLPPELRNSVYSYLAPSPTPTNTGLPLQLKSYSCKHTLIQICPTHSGSTSLLALQQYAFVEGNEYRTWLLNHAITLRIGVVFKGRVNTFVQEHWDKKIETHLHKLAKQHPWLNKVANYDIQILWDAPDGVLKSKHNRRSAGQVQMNGTLVRRFGYSFPSLRELFENAGLLRVEEDVLSTDRLVEQRGEFTDLGIGAVFGSLKNLAKAKEEGYWDEAEVERRRGLAQGDRESGAYLRWDIHVGVGFKAS